MTAAGNLFAQQEANRKASRRLIAGFIIFVAWLGFGGDLIWYLASSAEASERVAAGLTPGYVHYFPLIGLFLLIFSGVMAWGGYRFGAEALIKATGAQEITDARTDQQRRLVNVVEEMSIAAGVPKPRVWLVPDPAPNAFATGVSTDKSHIAVTHGLLDTCSRNELQAVVGHEMGHIVNLDVRLMTLLTALVGAIAIVHEVGLRAMRHSGGRRGGKGGGKGPGPLVLILFVLWIVSWIIAPLVTRFVVMKVGRSREYLADAMSAQFTRNPGALADALMKISESVTEARAIPKSSRQLCIADPYHSKWDEREGWFANLMATHPPLRERVERLRSMAYQDVGEVPSTQRPLSMSEA